MSLIKHIFTIIFLSLFALVSAQENNPVTFTYSVNDLGNSQFEAVLTAKIADGFHINSKDNSPDTVIPTVMKVSSKDGIDLIGGITEAGNLYKEFSEVFGGEVANYSGTVAFKQKFKLKNPAKPANIVSEITYQTCNDRVCFAPKTLEFEKSVTAAGTSSTQNTPTAPENTASPTTAISAKDSVKNGVNTTSSTNIPTANPEIAVTSVPDSKNLKLPGINLEKPLTDCGITQEKKSENYVTYLFLGFLGGLIALLTPCVYPMIPLTVSFFTKGNRDKAKGRKDAMIYGLFIFLIFTALSLPFHLLSGVSGNIFNQIATNVWLNLAFFAIFIYFAGSFFGYYDITLPSSIANKSSKAEEAGGLAGIFFMALTLVIVSFSCTGPILGSLLGTAVTGSSNVPMMLTFALAGFGLAWAIIFGLLALFPNMLKSLPKSGGWMNTVKVVLGFIEIALALKFLSKADLVSKTFFLKRELFIGIWILVTIGLVLYLFGLIRFPHDDKNPKISLTRKIIGFLGIGFIIYLIQGIIPSDKPKLQALSGILPPMNVSYFHDEKDGILGMHPEHDYFKAIEIAKKENKPVLIDFTGYGCENCRKMEEFVWSQPDILPILQNDVVLASLYVDDKATLPENEQTSVDLGNGQKQKIKTIGDRWSQFQNINFKEYTQPHYVLVTPDGKLINNPVGGYMPKEKFKNFLECGVNFYKSKK